MSCKSCSQSDHVGSPERTAGSTNNECSARRRLKMLTILRLKFMNFLFLMHLELHEPVRYLGDPPLSTTGWTKYRMFCPPQAEIFDNFAFQIEISFGKCTWYHEINSSTRRLGSLNFTQIPACGGPSFFRSTASRTQLIRKTRLLLVVSVKATV